MTPKFHKSACGRIAVMAGSFNPFTTGHLSILGRGLALFDKVVVMIGHNASKSQVSSSVEARVEILKELLSPLAPRVEVVICSGLVAVEAQKMGACALLRGVRSVADFEYERNMADVNRVISGLETVLLAAEPELAAISSSIVRELNSYGMETTRFLATPQLVELIKQRYIDK
ncbi:MAG: pantetheine-phosphate adenylyltransferase [Firmicutes bacterium]|nr:pantetheine-phosphate adenylyltransferase [Bacillota bacterium]MCM1401321.1 pantetheine-phosphate adenylyltransferase [Bacteroides sp.]MCM1477274.1 pantetheine-phosphate adenylyltransferase [Bacteroides sp.]